MRRIDTKSGETQYKTTVLLIFAVLFVILFSVADLKAQSSTCANGDQLVVNTSTKLYQCITPGAQPAGTGTTMIIANDTVTGTTVNKFAKLTGAPSKAIVSSNGDTENAIGVVTSGAGTTGNATITILGQVSCVFDGATTAGNYVTIAATGGGCHDAGSSYPTSGATYGRVLSTNGGAGTYVMELMTPDIAFQNAGNGKSKPGGASNDYQWNNNNTFAGAGPLYRIDGETIQVNSTSTTNGKIRLGQNNTDGRIEYAFPYISVYQNNNEIMRWGNSGETHIVRSDGIEQRSGGPYRWQSSTRLLAPSNALLRIDGNSDDTNGVGIIFGNNANANGARIKRDGTSNASLVVRTSSDSANRFLVDAGRLFTSAQFDKVNTTLTDVTGLVSETLTAGKTYAFEAALFVDADVTGGSKYAIAGTATATAIKYHVDMVCDATNLLVVTSRQTALAGSVGQAGCTAGLTRISGTITVNAAGTLTVQFAQNAANGTSSVLTMSKFEVRQLN